MQQGERGGIKSSDKATAVLFLRLKSSERKQARSRCSLSYPVAGAFDSCLNSAMQNGWPLAPQLLY